MNNSWSGVGVMWSTWFFEIDIWRYDFEKMKDGRYRNKELVLVTWNFTKFLDFCWDMINVDFLMHSSIFSPFFVGPAKKSAVSYTNHMFWESLKRCSKTLEWTQTQRHLWAHKELPATITRPETFFHPQVPTKKEVQYCWTNEDIFVWFCLNVFCIGTKKGFLDNELWVDRVDFNPWKPYCVISFHASHRICILQHNKNITLNRENN